MPSCCVQGQIYITFMSSESNSLREHSVHGPRNTAQDDVERSGILKRDLLLVIPEMLEELSRQTKHTSF